MTESCEAARITGSGNVAFTSTAMRPQPRRKATENGCSHSIAWRRWYRPEPDVLHVAIASAGSGLSRAYSAIGGEEPPFSPLRTVICTAWCLTCDIRRYARDLMHE